MSKVVVPDNLTQDQLHSIKASFKLFDRNHDNAINSRELGLALNAMGQNPTQAEVRALVRDADKDHNGTLDFQEFLNLMATKIKPVDEGDELRKAFRVFDRDGNGTISAAELRNALTKLGEKLTDAEVDKMFSDMDKDGDGEIQWEEFVQHHTKNNKKYTQLLTGKRESDAAKGKDGAQYSWGSVPDLWKDDAKANFSKEKLEEVFPGQKSAGSKRNKLWRELDNNGNGYVSLAEFDGWFNQTSLAVEGAAGVNKGEKDGKNKSELFRYARPALIRAFNLANGIAPDTGKGDLADNDYVTKSEFRLLLVALQAALCIFRLFDIADTSDDKRVSKDEWTAQLEVINGELQFQGYTGPPVGESDFDLVDSDGGGMILLDEAVSFFLGAFTKEAALLESDIDSRPSSAASSHGSGKKERPAPAERPASGSRKSGGSAGSGGRPGSASSQTSRGREADAAQGEDGGQYAWGAVPDLWKDEDKANFSKEELEKVFPSQRSNHAARDLAWGALDYNGNGYVSLAEYDSWFNQVTLKTEQAAGVNKGAKEGKDKSELFRYARSALIRAFNLANGIAKENPNKSSELEKSADDFVTKPEFRMLMVATQAALCIYRLFDIADTSDDKRVTKDEWTAQLDVINAELEYQGFSGEKLVADDFDKVDADGGGVILLDEAVYFFLNAFTSDKTLLAENEEEGVVRD